jgi:hypothetical protein
MRRAHIEAFAAAGALISSAALVGCDFKVTKPGPVQSPFLNDPSAAVAIVNGAGRDLSDALNWIAYTGASPAREIFPAGSTGSFGITPFEQVGKLTDDESNTHWNLAQRARYEAEDGAARLKTSLGSGYGSSKNVAQILIWAGYANRLLGENMCQAVINGSAAMPYTAFLDSAEVRFTNALAVATAAKDSKDSIAALAGRASVRVDKGNWAGAIADAAGIADNFVYAMPYYTTDQDQYNRIYWATANQPYRAHTVWNTVYDAYYTNTKDPRVAWSSVASPAVGDAAVLQIGQVPWHFEMKYAKKDASINLSSGWEMRLIEAEKHLMDGDLAGAMPLINKHRVALGLQPWSATTIDDGWTALKRERGIELWLEARRMNDLRRWKAGNTPGALDPLEMPGTGTNGAPSYLTQQDLCFPIPLSEQQTNPHFSGS